jgi:hypothetical protein
MLEAARALIRGAESFGGVYSYTEHSALKAKTTAMIREKAWFKLDGLNRFLFWTVNARIARPPWYA